MNSRSVSTDKLQEQIGISGVPGEVCMVIALVNIFIAIRKKNRIQVAHSKVFLCMLPAFSDRINDAYGRGKNLLQA